jgi:hypothetical protein
MKNSNFASVCVLFFSFWVLLPLWIFALISVGFRFGSQNRFLQPPVWPSLFLLDFLSRSRRPSRVFVFPPVEFHSRSVPLTRIDFHSWARWISLAQWFPHQNSFLPPARFSVTSGRRMIRFLQKFLPVYSFSPSVSVVAADCRHSVPDLCFSGMDPRARSALHRSLLCVLPAPHSIWFFFCFAAWSSIHARISWER